jgi:hypothetical protein
MKGENRGWFGSAGNCRSLSRREVEYLLATLSMMADTPKAGAPVSFHPPQGKRMPGTRGQGVGCCLRAMTTDLIELGLARLTVSDVGTVWVTCQWPRSIITICRSGWMWRLPPRGSSLPLKASLLRRCRSGDCSTVRRRPPRVDRTGTIAKTSKDPVGRSHEPVDGRSGDRLNIKSSIIVTRNADAFEALGL